MSSNTFLAVFLGSKTSPQMTAWNALPEAEQKAKMQKGLAAWHGWVEKHKSAIVELGGPLGKTLKVDARGIHEVTNALSGFTVIRAASQEEAAKLFENHAHFSIFPGEAVEIMPVLPIPGGS
jgi:hypothetical protein